MVGLKSRVSDLAERVDEGFRRSIFKRLTKPSLINTIRSRGIEIVYLLIFFLLMAGVVNAAMEGSVARIYQAMIATSRQVQTWGETIINLFTVIVGSAGFYLIYTSSKPTLRGRLANLYLTSGIVAILIAVAIGLIILMIKI